MKDVVRFIIFLVFSVLFRVRITGKENVPAKGAAILCSNHHGELDMFFIGYRIKRLVRWVAKEELFKNPIAGAFFRWAGAFPVKRGKADVGAIRTALRLLEDGHIVGMFPEGTRMKTKERKNVKIKPGAAMFAIESGAPILPVAVRGSYKLFGRIDIIFGKPFTIDVDRNRKYSSEELQEISQGIMTKVYALLEEK